MAQHVIEMREITKKFDDFVANDHINLDLRKGEIHALLGENGAGKSTLMNMLAGLLEPTSGSIKINGSAVTIDSPSKSAQLGIGMVHQHFMLVEAFTVTENIILGNEVVKNGILDLKKAGQEIKALSEKYGLAVDPNAKIADISVGAQQRVEILKTLYRGADILIFDEIDTGIGGETVRKIALKLKEIGDNTQIISITHSAVIASKASQQFYIEKYVENSKTISRVKKLSAEERIKEIGRMLVGEKINNEVLEIANKMLNEG